MCRAVAAWLSGRRQIALSAHAAACVDAQGRFCALRVVFTIGIGFLSRDARERLPLSFLPNDIMATDFIELAGVATNNLREIDVRFPHHRLTAVTGVSGSGKSSLAVETLYAECRQYVLAALSPSLQASLAKRYVSRVQRAEGLLPAVLVSGSAPPRVLARQWRNALVAPNWCADSSCAPERVRARSAAGRSCDTTSRAPWQSYETCSTPHPLSFWRP